MLLDDRLVGVRHHPPGEAAAWPSHSPAAPVGRTPSPPDRLHRAALTFVPADPRWWRRRLCHTPLSRCSWAFRATRVKVEVGVVTDRVPLVELVASDPRAHDIPEVVFRKLQLSGSHPFTEIAEAPHATLIDDIIDPTWKVRCRVNSDRGQTLLAHDDGVYVLARRGSATIFECAATSAEKAVEMARGLRSRIAAMAPPESSGVTDVQMWSAGRLGGQSVTRSLLTPPWAEARVNYPSTVSEPLGALMKIHAPDRLFGRLLLWHGEPGSGKTSAIRSLIHEWRSWCTAHCIVDPDRFFAEPGYLHEVISSAPSRGQWKLIIAEDSDEFITATGQTGASLGRLLNLTDGLFGQGTNTLVLLTTNLPMSRLHPAVTRPGRCLSVIEFRRFSAAEVGERTGLVGATSMTLAELYRFRNDGTMPNRPTGNTGYV